MIIESTGVETKVAGAAGTVKQFHIAESAHTFRVLSSTLYNDRIQAIIRELSCNAYDSHVMAGKPETQFELHLPTTWEPFFSIRDFGTGLSEDDVTGLYCTYFNSTKAKSNNQIGSFGLGSKTPFSYTDAFTVTSYFNGVRYLFDAHISEEGMPNIVLMNAQASEEENGLEVKFPVRSDDMVEFMNKAAIALEFIEPRPKINRDFSPVKQDYVARTDIWGIRRKEHTAQSRTLRAIQGMVAYNVGNIDSSKLNDTHKLIIDLPIDLFFEIGQLAVAPSRESLSNDTRTVKNLLDRLDLVYLSMLDEVKAKLFECKTAWEARLLLAQLSGTTMGSIVRRGLKEKEFYGQYPNFLLTDEKLALNEMDYSHATVIQFAHAVDRVRSAKTFTFPQRTLEARALARTQAVLAGTEATEHRVEFTADAKTLFIVNDLAAGTERYIHEIIQNLRRYNTVFLITKADATADSSSLLVEAVQMLEKLGYPKSVMATDLAAEFPDLGKKIAAEAKERTTWKRRNLMKLIRETHDGCSFWKNWVRVDDTSKVPDAETPKYYLILNDCKPTFRAFTNCTGMMEYVNLCIASGLITGLDHKATVYGVKADSKLIGEPDWFELSGALDKAVRDYFTPERQLALSGVFGFTDASDLPKAFMKHLTNNLHLFSESSPIAVFAKKVSVLQDDLVNRQGVLSAFHEIRRSTGFQYTNFFRNLDKEYQALEKQYPLLETASSFSSYTRRVVLDDLVQYLIIKDSQRALSSLNVTQEEEAA
jgi:hypothetical protein